MARATVTYTAEITDLRKKLASIPDITAAEARKAVANLNKSVKAVERQQKRAAASSRKMKRNFSAVVESVVPMPSALSAALGPLGLFAAAMATAATASFKLANANSEWVDQTLAMAETTGLAANTVVALGAALEAGGQDIGAAQTGMASFTKALDDAQRKGGAAAEKFARLGVSVRDSSGNIRESEEVFRDTLDALDSMDRGVEKSGATLDLFGSKGARFMGALSGGSAALDEWGEAAAAAGAVVDQSALKASTDMDEAMARLSLSTTGAASSFGEAFTPNVVDAIDVTAAAITTIGNMADEIQAVGEAIKWLTVLPKVAEFAWGALADGEDAIEGIVIQADDLTESLTAATSEAQTLGEILAGEEAAYQAAQTEGEKVAKARAKAREKLADIEARAVLSTLDGEARLTAEYQAQLGKIAELEAQSKDRAAADAARAALTIEHEHELSELRNATTEEEREAAEDRKEADRIYLASKQAAIDLQQEEKQEAIDLATAQRASLDSVLSSSQDLAVGLSGAFADGSAAARAFYAVSQAIAASGAVISGLQASVAALLPPPIGLGPTFGPPLAAATAAFGYAQAGVIAAQTVASFADTPGPVRAGGHGMAATFAPGDTVIAGRDTRDIQRQLDGASGSAGPVVVERDVYRHLGRYGARDALRAPKAYEQVRRQARRTPGRR